MDNSSFVSHQRKIPNSGPISPELSEPNELEVAVERLKEADAVPISSKGYDSSIIDEIKEEIKNGDGSTFFFDSETEMFPESFSEDYLDFLHSYE